MVHYDYYALLARAQLVSLPLTYLTELPRRVTSKTLYTTVGYILINTDETGWALISSLDIANFNAVSVRGAFEALRVGVSLGLIERKRDKARTGDGRTSLLRVDIAKFISLPVNREPEYRTR